MKAVYIYNPHSGKGRKVKRINYIVNSLKNDYEVFDVIETKTREETITSASNACGKYDVLIFSGGDGTFNNILNGIGGYIFAEEDFITVDENEPLPFD